MMFVLEARSARLELGRHDRLRSVIRHLHGADRRALTEGMLRAVEEAAGLEDASLDGDWLAPQPHSALRRLLPEIFFADQSLFVLAPAGKRVDAWEVRRQDAPSTLEEFCAAVTAAVRSESVEDAPDEQAAEWRSRTLQLRNANAELDREMERPVVSPSPDHQAAARALADDDARGFITDLVRTGSSITDFDDSPMAHYASVGELHRQGLIEREHVIVCRQDHRTLGRVSDMSDEARQSILQLSCPTCGRRFDEELLRQVHAPSRAAMELVADGRWRGTWALALLQEHGLDDRDVTQLAGSGGNGVALRVDTLHGRLLVELPEAEFGMQHAYAMVRRLRRQSIEFGLVLATEPVADEAYQYLSERVAQDQGPMVSVLEGSHAVMQEIGQAIDEWSIISVRMLAEDLIDTTGIDFGAVIEAWMRRQLERSPAAEIDVRDDEGATVTTLSHVSAQ